MYTYTGIKNSSPHEGKFQGIICLKLLKISAKIKEKCGDFIIYVMGKEKLNILKFTSQITSDV